MYNKLTPEDWERIRGGNTGLLASDLDPLEWLDLAATYGGTAAAEIGGGLRGLLGLLYGENIDEAVAGMRNVQGLAYEPRTKDAQMVMGILGDTFAPVEEVMQSAREGAGDTAYDPTGSPAAGAAGYMAPDAALLGASAVVPPMMGVFPLVRRATRSMPDAPPKRGLIDAEIPPLLRQHKYDAKVNPETNTYSGLQQALLDIIAEREAKGIDLKLTAAQVAKQLRGRGVRDIEIEESGLPLTGNEVLNLPEINAKLQRVGRNPSNRMFMSHESSNFKQRFPDFSMSLLSPESAQPIRFSDTQFGMWDNKHVANHLFDRAFPWLDDSAPDPEAYSILLSAADRVPEIGSEAMKPVLDNLLNLHRSDSAWDSALPAVRIGRNFGPEGLDQFRKAVYAEAKDRYDVSPLNSWLLNDGRQDIRIEEDVPKAGETEPTYTIHGDADGFIGRIPRRALESYMTGQKLDPRVKWHEWKYGDPVDFEENFILQDEGFRASVDPTHWRGLQGVVAHGRASGRITESGDKTYFVDEIQSSPHDKGKKSGYQTLANRNRAEYLGEKRNAFGREAEAVIGEITDMDSDISMRVLQKMGELDGDDSWNQISRMFRAEIDAEYPDMGQLGRDSMFKYRVDAELINMLKDPKYAEMYAGVPEFVDLSKRYHSAKSKADELKAEHEPLLKLLKSQQPNIPLKEGRWIPSMMYQSLNKAVERDMNSITFANANDQKRVYIDPIRERFGDDETKWPEDIQKEVKQMRALYDQLYDKTIPAELRKMGKKYGVEPQQIFMKDDKLNNNRHDPHWMLPITPEMKRAIRDNGVPLYGKLEQGLLSPTQEQEKRLGGLFA